MFSENEIFWLKDKVQPLAWCFMLGGGGGGLGGLNAVVKVHEVES